MSVTVDASTASSPNVSNQSTISVNHTASNAGSVTGAIVVHVGFAGTETSCTYGGTAMTQEVAYFGAATAGAMCSIYSVGASAHTFSGSAETVTLNGTTLYGFIVVYTLLGGDSTTVSSGTATNTGTSSTASVTASTASDELVIDGAFALIGSFTSAGADQTAILNSLTDAACGVGSSWQLGSNGGVMSWNIASSVAWQSAAISCKAAGGGGGVVGSYFYRLVAGMDGSG